MSRQNLTDRFISSRKSASPGKREDYPDAIVPGLALRVTDRGHKTFVLITRYPSNPAHPTRRALGEVGAIGLDEAREKARRWLELIGKGIDPAAEEKKRRMDAAKRITFDELRTAFLKHFEQKKKHGEAVRILTKDFSAWNGRLASDIDAQDVDEAVRVIIDRGSKYQAINVFGYIRSMYGWAMGQPRLGIKASPCANLSAKTLIGKKKPRTRVLDDSEIRAIWKTCDKMAYPYGPIIRLLVLTAVRENEIACMSRSELDDRDAPTLLTIPSVRMKGEDDEPPPPHEIPLTARMAGIITDLPRLEAPYLFTTTGGRKPVNGWSKAKNKFDELSGVSGWIFHDLRRTVRTRISAIPAEEHVREALLAHGRRGIQAHYDHHKYRDEKRHLLQLWDDRLQKILNPPPPGGNGSRRGEAMPFSSR